ncbi:MAG TPA: MlaD family protein [Bryobacteraceae bacterium]|jgi:phospholipid/cholesterol/gamma-HCH transport system substrate-binding protein|nr:MlaD family protein [Bryobacteraceae bacterium]
MASQKKVRWAELRTGILAVASMFLVAVLIFLLTSQGSIFSGNFHLRTYFDDSEGLNANDPVRVNGILVGYIGGIRLTGARDPRRSVEVDMVVQNKFLDQIPDDSKSAISSANLLGTKFVNITKGTHPKHVEPGGEVQSLPSQGIPEIMAQSTNLLTQAQTIMGRLDGLLAIVENGQGNLGKLIKDDSFYDRINATAAELQQLVKDVQNSNGTLSHLLYDDQLYNDVRKPIQRVDDMLAEIQQGKGTLGKTMYDPQLYDEARASMTDAKQLLENLKAGKGTAGKLLNDDEIANQLKLIAQKVNTAIDKINSGQGTIGQLMINPQLYDALNATARDVDSLMKDVHKDPKKFLRIKLAIF